MYIFTATDQRAVASIVPIYLFVYLFCHIFSVTLPDVVGRSWSIVTQKFGKVCGMKTDKVRIYVCMHTKIYLYSEYLYCPWTDFSKILDSV